MQTGNRTGRALLVAAVIACAAWLAGPASAGTVHFKSPSGNIDCYLQSMPASSAQCLVKQATWTPVPRKPASCTLDWAPYSAGLFGQGVQLGACRGDVGPLCFTPSGACVTLAYGHAVREGTIRCSSSTTGITCRSTVGPKHGFRVSREHGTLYH
jgi:hypothetical protein